MIAALRCATNQDVWNTKLILIAFILVCTFCILAAVHPGKRMGGGG